MKILHVKTEKKIDAQTIDPVHELEIIVIKGLCRPKGRHMDSALVTRAVHQLSYPGDLESCERVQMAQVRIQGAKTIFGSCSSFQTNIS